MFVGNGSKVLLEHSLRAGSEQAITRLEEAMEIYARVFDQNCMYQVRPYSGIERLLRSLEQKGCKAPYFRINLTDRQFMLWRLFFGTDRFCHVQGQKPGVPRKPDPTVACMIAEQLGSTVEETIYIGDSEVDIQTGHAAGMRTIGVSWGFRSRACLEEAGAKYIAETPEEIFALISAWEEEKGR